MLHSLLNGGDLHAPTNYYVENDTGSDIPILKVVTYTGIGTNFPAIRTVTSTVDPVRGVTMTAISATAGVNTGYITSLGFLIGVNTSAWAEGTLLYADSSGNLTTTSNGVLVATVYKQDATLGVLFIEGVAEANGGSGGGDVVGPGSSTDKAIVRWDGTTGRLLENSLTTLQDGGAIEAQGFITRRSVTALVQVASQESWIAPELQLETSGSIEIEADGELVIV